MAKFRQQASQDILTKLTVSNLSQKVLPYRDGLVSMMQMKTAIWCPFRLVLLVEALSAFLPMLSKESGISIRLLVRCCMGIRPLIDVCYFSLA